MIKYNYNGNNGDYTIHFIYHIKEHGYALVKISAEGEYDFDIRIHVKNNLLKVQM